MIVAVKGLIDIPASSDSLMSARADFLAAALTMLGVLTFGMLEGIIIGVLFSFLAVLKRVSLPNTSLLARKPGTTDYVSVDTLEETAVETDTMIFRADAGWFYANAPIIMQEFDRALDQRSQAPSLVVIDLATAPVMDLGTISTLNELRETLNGKNIPLRLANVHRSAQELIEAAAPDFGPVRPSLSIAEIVDEWQRRSSPEASTSPRRPN